ncbi:MAG: hypothetical protein H6Q07_572 [Acidobacteria bacterium]|jgi:hypothetical protein|nr:hypothetical protein [Acidobacteriota bacterium]
MFQPVRELLSEAEVVALFVQVTTALCVTISLDGVDRLPEGYRIRSHDFYSPLPDIEIESTHNMAQALDRISLSVARLGATVRFRRELAAQARDCRFIVPTSIGEVTVVGICTGGRTVRARGENACQAYQKLNRKMTELSPQAA